MSYSNNLNKLFHVLLGVLCVIVPIQIVSKQEINDMPKWLKKCDEYSYFVYLTHHVLMIGPLSMALLFKSKSLNIFLMLIITAFLTFLLKITYKEITCRIRL